MFIMTMIRTMNTSITLKKKQTAFRFSEDLLERLKELAKKDNRSLNNYVEKILIEKVYNEKGISKQKYIKVAIAEKLKRDGFLSE